jgi:hypothetical protein
VPATQALLQAMSRGEGQARRPLKGIDQAGLVQSVKPIEIWLASQNGLLAEAPHLHKVTRFRTS